MTACPDDPERKALAYADSRPVADDNEPVYSDGTPKYECWNSGSPAAPTKRQKAPVIRHRDFSDDEPRDWPD